MCRNIKTLFNFDPPATEEEIRSAAIQYVRKVSGFSKPSQVNTTTFELAVDQIAAATQQLMNDLQTNAPSKNREVEAEKARERSRKRFG